MRFDVRVMAHPKRKDRIQRFCAEYGIPQESVSYDDSGSALNGAKKAYLSDFDEGISHRLVLQDDVKICDGFFDIVQKNIESFPFSVFSYYEGQDITFADKVKQSPYIRMKGCCVCGLAVVIPKDVIVPCFEWIAYNFPADYRHDDCAIGLYCLTHGISVFFNYPKHCPA